MHSEGFPQRLNESTGCYDDGIDYWQVSRGDPPTGRMMISSAQRVGDICQRARRDVHDHCTVIAIHVIGICSLRMPTEVTALNTLTI